MNPPFIELLPRDMELDGRTFAQLYRSNERGGGRIVYLRNSEPGIARGHTIHCFEIIVGPDGKEQLGKCLLVTPKADDAIMLAGQAPIN
jgi:hypothetical protein